MKPTVVAEYQGDYVKCPFCPCVFVNEGDLKIHLKAFGTNKLAHVEKFVTVHYYNYGYYREGRRRFKELMEEVEA